MSSIWLQDRTDDTFGPVFVRYERRVTSGIENDTVCGFWWRCVRTGVAYRGEARSHRMGGRVRTIEKEADMA